MSTPPTMGPSMMGPGPMMGSVPSMGPMGPMDPMDSMGPMGPMGPPGPMGTMGPMASPTNQGQMASMGNFLASGGRMAMRGGPPPPGMARGGPRQYAVMAEMVKE